MDKSLGYYIKRIGRSIKKYIDNSDYVKENPDVTNVKGFVIGYTLEQNRKGNKVYQKDIEAQFKFNRSTASEVLSNLEELGYITRVASIDDLRLKEIIVTDKGYSMINNFMKLTDKIDDIAFKGLTDDEVKTLKELLARVILNFDGKDDDNLC